jgi:hypothetical protein
MKWSFKLAANPAEGAIRNVGELSHSVLRGSIAMIGPSMTNE